MAQKNIGYIKLIWVCPNCQTKNPGPQKTCSGCGAPQPKDVRFRKDVRDELVKDEKEIEQAKLGPDIHCAYCGARNTADAQVCINCGADLTAGDKRESGTVLGALNTGPAVEIDCPHCGAKNPDTAQTCSKCGGSLATPEPVVQAAPAAPPKKKANPVMLAVGGLALIFLCIASIFFLSLLGKEENLTGQVIARKWQRSIIIEQYGPVEKRGWQDEIPASATVGTCELRVHHSQPDPASNSREICGTPYTKDTGTGYAEVVQDCYYEVYEEYCIYTVNEWTRVDTVTVDGFDSAAYWPQPSLSQEQRLGNGTESYSITFYTSDGNYEYKTSNESIYNQAVVGTKWDLTINAFGNITDISQ